MSKYRNYMSRETRVAMMADWLLGLSTYVICHKYKITCPAIYYWARKHKEHFKMRSRRRASSN